MGGPQELRKILALYFFKAKKFSETLSGDRSVFFHLISNLIQNRMVLHFAGNFRSFTFFSGLIKSFILIIEIFGFFLVLFSIGI